METQFINNTELDVNKYLEFNKFHYLSNKSNKIFFTLNLLIGIFLLITSITRLIQDDTHYFANLLLGLLLIGMAFYPRLRVKWWFRRFIRTEKRLPMDIEYRFGADSFEAKTSHSTEEIRYDQLYKIVETDRFYYLYINKLNACIVDKNGFASDTAAPFTSFLKTTAPGIFTDRATKKSR